MSKQEVDMVWRPADPKYSDHDDHHLDNFLLRFDALQLFGGAFPNALTAPQFETNPGISVAHGDDWQHVSHQQYEDIVDIFHSRFGGRTVVPLEIADDSRVAVGESFQIGSRANNIWQGEKATRNPDAHNNIECHGATHSRS